MKFFLALCFVAVASGSILRPAFPDNDGPILRPVFPEEDEHPGSGIIALPAEVAPLVQIIVNIQKSGESVPVIDAPHFGPPAVEEVPDVPVVAPEFQPDVPIVPLVPVVPDERPPVGLFPIIPDLNRPGLPGANPELVRPIIPDDLDLAPDGLPWRF